MLFDPDAFKDQADQLTVANHRLTQQKLREYAELATRIRRAISRKASASVEEEKSDGTGRAAESVMSELWDGLGATAVGDEYDRTVVRIRMHPRRKRRPVRRLSVAERLEVVKLAASKTKSPEQIACLFDIKVRSVYDLLSDAKRKQRYFVKKKEIEMRRAERYEMIIKAVRGALASKQVIYNAKQIQKQVKAATGVDVPANAVISTMKTTFKLSYRRIKRTPKSVN